MLKKLSFVLIFSFIFFESFSQSTELKIRFLKGNILDKTIAVREASGQDAIWFTDNAIEFVLENKDILGTDRELDALAVAAVLSVSNDYLSNCTDQKKNDILNNFIQIFEIFPESKTVQMSVVSKVLNLKDNLNTKIFVQLLNRYLSENDLTALDSGSVKFFINALEQIGDNTSFITLYSLWSNNKYAQFFPEIENALAHLTAFSIDEIIYIIKSKNISKIQPLFDKIIKKSNISQNLLCEVAENVLSVTNILVENSSSYEKDKETIIKLQMDSLMILNDNKWTRSSGVALASFNSAKKHYFENAFPEEQFIMIIKSLNNVAPIAAISSLTYYLEELNSYSEKGTSVSQNLIIAVIQTLGAIGDKSAFDSLLAVTYLSYPEPVLTAAREALSGLKW